MISDFKRSDNNKGSILNIDATGLQEYKNRRNALRIANAENEELKSKISSMQQELINISNKLDYIIGKIDKCQ